MIDDNISATKQESCAVTDTTNENNNSDSKTESTNRVASPVSSEISELSDGKQVKQINQRDSSVDEFNSCSNTNKRFKAVNETPQEQTQNQKYESMQPRLKKFLKIYQLSAKNSLSGPSQAEIEMSLQSTSQSLSNSQTTPNESSQTQVEQQQPQEHQQQQTSLSIIANVAVALAADEQANESAKIKRSKSQTKQKTNSNLSYLKCIQADQDTTHLMETLLHGERISCFIVGGEKRLCLHDILNLILKDFSVQQINQACQKLSIACLESTPKQLDILKRNHLLPPGAPNCGLLTQTNAERLCAYLMDSSLSESIAVETPPSSTSSSPTSHAPSTLKVVHECFGKTYGHLHINMYSRSDSACVECDTCRKLYTPKNFVCHTHKYETHTRHWGFDSSNWRIYLKLANTPSLTTEESTKSVLTDLKISNKDNIAANQNIINNNNSNNSNQVTSQNQNTNSENKEKEKLLSIQEEEFELFKQKFLTNDLKQNSLPSNVTINSSNGNLSALNQSSFVSQRNHRTSLTDLNNQLIQSKNKAEHKLLNGLLSKPLNSNDTVNSMSIPIVQQCLNQPNVVIQNNSQSLDQIIKSKLNTNGSNKKSTDNNGKYYLNGGDEYSLSAEATKAQVNNNSSPQLLSSYYNYFNSKLMTTNKSFTQQVQATSNIELNMLDLILNEIDLSIESKESAERLRQMVTQMHIYFSEKLNDQFYIKNKMLAEFEEYKMALQNENEQLRCQLKLYQIQNELSKEHYLLKKTPTSAGALNINHLLPLQNQKSCSSPSSSASPSSTNNTHSSTKANTNTSNNQILQNLLLLQQQQQQHSSSKNQDQLHAFAAAAAQSLPQYFFNHYTSGLSQSHHRNSIGNLLEPITSTPKKALLANTSNKYTNPLKCELNPNMPNQTHHQSTSNPSQTSAAV